MQDGVPPDLQKSTILMVEDNEEDILLLKRAFRHARIANPLIVVRDGEHAIKYFSGAGDYGDRTRYPLPFLMLLDLRLPKISGFAVLEWIREELGLQELIVMILTGSDHGNEQTRFRFSTWQPVLDPLLHRWRQFPSGVGGNHNQVRTSCSHCRRFGYRRVAQEIEAPPTEIELDVLPEFLHKPVANLQRAVTRFRILVGYQRGEYPFVVSVLFGGRSGERQVIHTAWFQGF